MAELARDVADFFPYAEVRPFQDEFIKTIFNAVKEGFSVAIEGSNGLRKNNCSTIGMSFKSLGEELEDIVCCAHNGQHDRVIERLKNISRKQSVSGLSVRGALACS